MTIVAQLAPGQQFSSGVEAGAFDLAFAAGLLSRVSAAELNAALAMPGSDLAVAFAILTAAAPFTVFSHIASIHQTVALLFAQPAGYA